VIVACLMNWVVNNANSLIALYPHYLGGYKTSDSEIERTIMHQLSLIVAGLDGEETETSHGYDRMVEIMVSDYLNATPRARLVAPVSKSALPNQRINVKFRQIGRFRNRDG
jgi:hypothetical protein